MPSKKSVLDDVAHQITKLQGILQSDKQPPLRLFFFGSRCEHCTKIQTCSKASVRAFSVKIPAWVSTACSLCDGPRPQAKTFQDGGPHRKPPSSARVLTAAGRDVVHPYHLRWAKLPRMVYMWSLCQCHLFSYQQLKLALFFAWKPINLLLDHISNCAHNFVWQGIR